MKNPLLLAKLEPYSILGTYKITGVEGGRQAKVLYPPAASGVQDDIAPNLSGLRRYSPIRPCQTHSITPF